MALPVHYHEMIEFDTNSVDHSQMNQIEGQPPQSTTKKVVKTAIQVAAGIGATTAGLIVTPALHTLADTALPAPSNTTAKAATNLGVMHTTAKVIRKVNQMIN